MNHYLRNAITLGSLTALFLLVRCTVPERDYALIINGGNGGDGSGGSGGSGSGAVGGTSAGLGGGAGQGGQDAGTIPVEPIPCDAVIIDAGLHDAGNDAGDAALVDASSDASSPNGNPYGEFCACVDGFIQAVDADADGLGTRACALAPGLDCDDGDGAVTHNACGGCTELPNAIGEDCLECGAYTCDGPDAVVCGAKPEYDVVDPDCRCESGLIVARDTDGDGEGTRLCEENPGNDCNDGDGSFVTNQCGGCSELPGVVGGACNQCGAWACQGTALVCVPKTGSAGRQCLDFNTRQTCIGTGFWSTGTDCVSPTAVCYRGNCEVCNPGTYKCDPLGSGSYQLEQCMSTSSLGVHWSSVDSCAPPQTCNANLGRCVGSLFLPRDPTFDVVPLLERSLPWHELLNTASDSDYG